MSINIEVGTGVALDPVAGAVLGAHDGASANGVAGVELRDVFGALRPLFFPDEIGGEASHAFVNGPAEGRGDGGRDPFDGAAADAGHDVGGIFGEQAVAFLRGGETFGGEVALGDIAPSPGDLVVDAHGADVEAAFLAINLQGERVIVDHERFARFIRIAGHGEESAGTIGREKLEQPPAEYGLPGQTVILGGGEVGVVDPEVFDLSGRAAHGRKEEVRIEEGVQNLPRRGGEKACGG